MGLSEVMLRGIKRNGYRLPTPIQRKTLPLILQGVDVVGMARTGSGKTAAFVIPMIEKLRAHSPKAGARALILSPTRELALQTHKVVTDLGRYHDLRTAVLVGGDSMEAQFAELAVFPDVLVATPGGWQRGWQWVAKRGAGAGPAAVEALPSAPSQPLEGPPARPPAQSNAPNALTNAPPLTHPYPCLPQAAWCTTCRRWRV